MRLAFLGTSHVHTLDFLKACRSIPGVELLGIAEPDTETVGLLPDLPAVFERQEDLPDHDVTVILTDAASHDRVCAKVTAPAAFVEKPLGVTGARAQAISDHLTGQGIATETGFFLRHSEAFKTVQNACRAPEMGPIRFARFEFVHPGFLDGWLRAWPAHCSDDRMGGGAFVDLAIHLVDAATCIVGDLAASSCDLDTGSHHRFGLGPSFETQGQATLRSKDGALVHIWASAEAPETGLKIEISCEGGEVVLDGGRVTQKYRDANAEVLREGAMPTPADGFRAAIEGFRDGRDRIVLIEDAVKASVLMEKIVRSASGNPQT